MGRTLKRKRPLPSDTPHNSLQIDHEGNDCPICLESCSPHQSFQLECCNRSLAAAAPRQMVHKTCFFASCRHTLEAAVKNGESLMRMSDHRLRDLFHCPRCRSALPFRRDVFIEDGAVTFAYRWTDGCQIAQACQQFGVLEGVNTVTHELVLFYATIMGTVGDPLAALRSSRVTGPTLYAFVKGIPRLMGEEHKAPGPPITNAKQRLVGVVIPDDPLDLDLDRSALNT